MHGLALWMKLVSTKKLLYVCHFCRKNKKYNSKLVSTGESISNRGLLKPVADFVIKLCLMENCRVNKGSEQFSTTKLTATSMEAGRSGSSRPVIASFLFVRRSTSCFCRLLTSEVTEVTKGCSAMFDNCRPVCVDLREYILRTSFCLDIIRSLCYCMADRLLQNQQCTQFLRFMNRIIWSSNQSSISVFKFRMSSVFSHWV